MGLVIGAVESRPRKYRNFELVAAPRADTFPNHDHRAIPQLHSDLTTLRTGGNRRIAWRHAFCQLFVGLVIATLS